MSVEAFRRNPAIIVVFFDMINNIGKLYFINSSYYSCSPHCLTCQRHLWRIIFKKKENDKETEFDSDNLDNCYMLRPLINNTKYWRRNYNIWKYYKSTQWLRASHHLLLESRREKTFAISRKNDCYCCPCCDYGKLYSWFRKFHHRED